MKSQLDEISRRRVEVEQRKNKLENLLRVNLVRRRDKLEAQVKDRSVEDKRYQLETDQEQQKRVNERLMDLNKHGGGIFLILLDVIAHSNFRIGETYVRIQR